ncbi:MAG: efflux RND transporter periplasmic adaptor subunit [Sandaracinus sp.]|nr:efflux RND transporter periplasmic adaptor subunit [Sandaracinus sp.]MCB9631036.1 efflux RND transporter periplasmic adaptor subunit [Sandaracinus sp.]
MRTRSTISTLTLALLGACSGAQVEPPSPRESADGPITSVHVGEATRGEVVPHYVATGSVRAFNTATITSRAMGYVRTLEFSPGDHVRRGDLMATLDDADPRAGLLQAQATSLEAEAALAEYQERARAAQEALRIARTTWERMRAMRADQSISQQAADEAEAAFHIAEAEARATQSGLRRAASRIAQTRAGVQSARANLEYSRIRAPFDGVVLSRPAQVGDTASPGAPLFVLEQQGGLRVEVAVPESLAGTLTLNDTLWVHVDAVDDTFEGTLGEIAPQVDTAARSVLVKVDVPSEASGALHAGMFARVSVPRPVVDALTVPANAVSPRGSLDRVFVVADGEARLRLITRGMEHGDRVAVLAGLEPGERVVLDPPTTLRDRDAVEVLP